MQVLRPGVAAIVPAWQAVQVLDVSVLILPAGHAVQVAEPLVANFPARQSLHFV